MDDDGDNKAYRPRSSLPKPSIQERPISELLALLDNGTLIIDPEYQRDVVWPREKMVGLVDSLMDDCYVPPLIFNSTSTPTRKLICVDGKQRLSSVKAFIDGTIPCTDTNKRRWYFRTSIDQSGQKQKKRKNILPEHVKLNFLSKPLTYCELADLSLEQEEEIFSRVQLGVPLSAAEKSRAKSGPWNDLIKLFEVDFKDVLSLSETKRAKDYQNILLCFAQILETRDKGAHSPSKLQSTWASLDKFIQDKRKLTPANRSHFAKVFTTFKELAAEDPQTFKDNDYKQSKNFAAVELVAVAVLISRCEDGLSHEALLGAIRAMREAARRDLKDLFTNTLTWNFFWSFIRKVEVSETQATDGLESMEEDDNMPIVISDGEHQGIVQEDTPMLDTAGSEEIVDAPTQSNGRRKSLIVKLPIKRKALSDTEPAPPPQRRKLPVKDSTTPANRATSIRRVAPISNNNGDATGNDSSSSDVVLPRRRSKINGPTTPRVSVRRHLPPGIMPGTRTQKRRRASNKKPASATAGGATHPSDNASDESDSQSTSSEEPSPSRRVHVPRPATGTPRSSILGIATRFNYVDAYDESDGTSSGYSTHSEPRGRPFRQPPRTRTSSRHSTVPNITSPEPISRVDGTVDARLSARPGQESPDPLRDDGDDTIRPPLSTGPPAMATKPASFPNASRMSQTKDQRQPMHLPAEYTEALRDRHHSSASQASERTDKQWPSKRTPRPSTGHQQIITPVERQPSPEARPITELLLMHSLDQHGNIPATFDGRRPSTDNETRSYTADRSSAEYATPMDLDDDLEPLAGRKPIVFPKVETGARALAEKRRKAREERERLAAQNNF